jgi:uncharacterized protein (TIGR02147 family)
MNTSPLKIAREKISVFDYTEYRSYLRALYDQAKCESKSYSYAALSKDLGLASTNAFAVINGKRNLTEKTAKRICEKLSLSAKATKYFLALFKAEHARSAQEREDAYQERLSLRKRRLPNELERHQLAFFEHWHNAAILEMLRLERASDSPEWLAENIQPDIGLPKVKASLELLKTLGYIAWDKDRGRLYPTEAAISTGNEVERLAILSYHHGMLDLAMHAMDKISAQDRDIGALTFVASDSLKEKIKEEVIAFRKRMISLAHQDKEGQHVIQLNMQFFPLSKKEKAK